MSKSIRAARRRAQAASPLKRKWTGDPMDVPRDLDGAHRVRGRLDGRKPPEFKENAHA